MVFGRALSSALVFVCACGSAEVWTGRLCGRAGCDAGGPDTVAACPGCDASLACTRCDGGACSACDAVERPGCPSGRFVMDVVAAYRPSPSGVCFLVGPTSSLDQSGRWYLTMRSDASADGSSADVQGCIRVPGQGEDAGASDIDWRSAVTGHMDCDAGTLDLEVRSTYHVVSVCTLGVIPTRYFAKGTLRTQYDRITDTFSAGELVLREPPVLIGEQPGGEGTFAGGRAPGPVPDFDVSTEHCLGVTFPEAAFTDAGVSPIAGDAGAAEAGASSSDAGTTS
jgi:hypothetical protein